MCGLTGYPHADTLRAVETIMDYLLRRLRPLTARQRAAIEQQLGLSKGLTTKILCGERDNPRIGTVQPLIDFFRAVDSGTTSLPAAQAMEASREAA